MNRFLTLLFSIFLLLAEAQEFEHYPETWNTIQKEFKKDKLSITLDASLRFFGFPMQWRQQLGRIQVGFAPNTHYSFNAGYIISNQYPHSGTSEAILEHRVHLQFAEHFGVNRYSGRNRFRWEYRMFEDIVDHEGFNAFNRFRIQHRSVLRFKNNQRNALVAAEELLFQSAQLRCFGLDQNRIYLGFRREITKTVSAEIAYMNLLADRKHGRYEMNHVIWLTLSF